MIESWVKRTSIQDSAIQNRRSKIHPLTLASFVHLRKDIYSDHNEKLAEWPTVRTFINQEERRRDKTPARINVQSLMTSIGE